MTAPVRMNVIALVSGGKDSFLSLLHCVANGHRVVALANLHPPELSPSPSSSGGPGSGSAPGQEDGRESGGALAAAANEVPEPAANDVDREDQEEEDLNSFMYQTVGHTVVPLYGAATGIPLFRRPIVGGATQDGTEYAYAGPPRPSLDGEDASSAARPHDETESMVPLLRDVMRAHPEANAICAGAILSTYQRTRVESVATRLGLVPLAYLWQFPVLPLPPSSAADGDVQLLQDLGAAGLEARIIKVASAGLDEAFLWANIANPGTITKVQRAMGRFSSAEKGAVLGEGGEFETLVVDGPRRLFRGRIVVEEADRRVVREGGGSAWLSIQKASVIPKPEDEAGDADNAAAHFRIPDLLDPRFVAVKAMVSGQTWPLTTPAPRQQQPPSARSLKAVDSPPSRWWCFLADTSHRSSIEEETRSVVAEIRAALARLLLPPNAVTSTVVLLRDMAAFPIVNGIYGPLFPIPNPPARVTIACGDRLPAGVGLAVFVAVHTRRKLERRGLHVQSRSYWAPANIGPYSQAIAVPLLAEAGGEEEAGGGPWGVSVAGQIPLVPATMELPAAKDDFGLQAVLALQHLWRIGAEMRVQWWCSAVAYLPSSLDASAREMAVLAGRAWEAAHSWSHHRDSGSPSDDEDDDSRQGPDLWDRAHHAAYRSFRSQGTDDDETQRQRLPDWEAVESQGDSRPAPPTFVAEVAALPRAAGVEWHAHLGLSHVETGSIRLLGPLALSAAGGSASFTLVRSRGGTTMIHGVIALGTDVDEQKTAAAAATAYPSFALKLDALIMESLVHLETWAGVELHRGGEGGQMALPDLVYADLEALEEGADEGAARDRWLDIITQGGYPVIPCVSLWDVRGERLSAIVTYRVTLRNETRSDGEALD